VAKLSSSPAESVKGHCRKNPSDFGNYGGFKCTQVVQYNWGKILETCGERNMEFIRILSCCLLGYIDVVISQSKSLRYVVLEDVRGQCRAYTINYFYS